MKFLVAFSLVSISLTAVESARTRNNNPEGGYNVEPENGGYEGRGWRPAGPNFNTPQRGQLRDQYGPPSSPPPSYGAPEPKPSYGPPTTPPEESNITTTEVPTTTEYDTENPQTENIKVDLRSEKVRSSAIKQEEQPRATFFVVLPQAHNLVYTVPQRASLVQETPARLQVAQNLPLTSVPSSPQYSPYSGSLLQIYQ